jgi:hypothetical protein
MTYFPELSNTPTTPKKCPGCGEWYVRLPEYMNVACTVAHSPGSCCHFGESKVQSPPPEKP